MKTKLFSKKLYKEALHQLKLPGIATFAIVFFTSILIPLGYILSDRYESLYEVTISAGELAPILIIYMFGAPVLLTILLFYFMNKRSASDFYHSLPHTRISLFISFIAAILTVLYVTIIVTTISCGVLYLVAGVQFKAISMLYVILTISAGATLVASATAIGMSLTGTFVSNLSVTVLALFLPRVLLVALTVITAEIVRIVPVIEMGVLGNVAYNIPSNLIMGVFVDNRFTYDKSMTFVGGIIYTFVLAIIYIAIGSSLFNKRKSETAEKSSPSKVMQHVYRCLVTLPFTLIITGTMLMSENPIRTLYENRMEYITLLVICLLVYYMFEIITTKKLSNVIKATPILLVLVGLNIIFAISVYVSKTVIYSYSPNADKIEWVTLGDLTSYNNYEGMETFATSEYSRIMLDGLKIEDPSVNKIVADALANSIDIAKKLEKYNNYVSMETSTPYIVPFKIKASGSFERDRILSLTTKQYRDLYKILLLNDEFVKATTNLPDEKEITGKYLGFKGHTNQIVDSNGRTYDIIEVEELYDIFAKEYDMLTTEQKISLINSEYNYRTEYADPMEEKRLYSYDINPVSITVIGSVGTKNFRFNCAITNLTPKAYEYVWNKTNEKAGVEVIRLLNTPFEDIEDIQFNIFSHDIIYGENRVDVSGYIYKEESENPWFSREQLQNIFATILIASDREFDSTQLTYSFVYCDLYGNAKGVLYVNLTEDEAAIIRENSIRDYGSIKYK